MAHDDAAKMLERDTKDTQPLGPVTVSKTACVLDALNTFRVSHGAARFNSILGGAAVACLGAEAQQRRSYGKRRIEHRATQVIGQRQRASRLHLCVRHSGLGSG